MSWCLRLLHREPKARIAILSHDPSVVGAGALLGDRATMINSQNERVFMRSMAPRVDRRVGSRRRRKIVFSSSRNPGSIT